MPTRATTFVLILAVLGLGCRRLTTNVAIPVESAVIPASTGPLRIAAASDLQSTLTRLIARFEDAEGGRFRVAEPTFGASGQLAAQIRQGAPFDLFLAANEAYVKALADDGTIVADSVATYTRGVLVLAVHPSAADRVRGLDDLRAPDVRAVAIANPEFAPYGAAAKRALEAAGFWDALQPKLARAESVRQALQFVLSGDADAGLVGRSIARAAGDRVVLREIAPSLAPPIPQALGVVAGSPNDEAARAFARFLLSAEGQSLLVTDGFATLDEAPD